MAASAPSPSPAALPEDTVSQFVADFKSNGYGVVRGVFSAEEIQAIKQRFDAWYADCLDKHGDKSGTWVKGNMRVWMGKAPEGRPGDGAFVRGMQWPSYTDPTLDAIRADPRLFQLLQPLLGSNIKQLINQMHWKLPGSQTQWRYHQDIRSRKPDSAFRNIGESYVQVGIAIERHDKETGGMKVLPLSHLAGKDLGIEAVAKEMGLDNHGACATDAEYDELLKRVGHSYSQLVDLDCKPGDLVAWGPFLIHGGGLNTTKPEEGETRAFYINGYVKGENSDRGHWVWKEGVPQPLGEPVLIQMEQFKETEALGGVHYATDYTGLTDREIEQAKAIGTVRD